MSNYTKYTRSLKVTIIKKIGENIAVGYPKTYPLPTDVYYGYFTVNGFDYTIPSDYELARMSELDYEYLLDAFISYVSEHEDISFGSDFTNSNVGYDPVNCSGDTTTTTTTLEPTTTVEPTTTLQPIIPVNFTVRYVCTPSLSNVIIENYFGGSGIYEVGVTLYASEAEALSATTFNAGISPYIYSSVPDGTYWVIVRDVNNPTNITAKMIDVICSSTTTIEPTTTLEPIPPTTTTTTEEPNLPPVAYNHSESLSRGVGACTQGILPYPDDEWFPYSDSDGDTLNAIKFITVPQYGMLTKENNTPISAGEIITYPFTIPVFPYYYYLMYIASATNTGDYVDTVQFQVRTNNNPNWSNTATLSFNVAWCVRPTTTAGPEDCTIFVPDGFSPNGDGVNDYFEVYGLRCYPVHRMSIFKRSGELVYRRTNDYYYYPWDGKVNGVVYQTTYTWILEIDGQVHSTGSVFTAL